MKLRVLWCFGFVLIRGRVFGFSNYIALLRAPYWKNLHVMFWN
jgi:hypothetical protein